MMTEKFAEGIVLTTLRLAAFNDGKAIGTGTGFWWRIASGTQEAYAIVTNKHVVKGADELRVTVHTHVAEQPFMPAGPVVELTVKLLTDSVIDHPDAAVDLCGTIVTDAIAQARAQGITLLVNSFSRNSIPSDKEWGLFDAIEEVHMIGYPKGLADTYNTRPLVRRGITATAVSLDYEGRQEFMVDMACYPGSSGSPVFIHETTWFDYEIGKQVVGPEILLTWIAL